MDVITIDEIKAHARIEIDDEDEILELYGDSAEAMVCNIMNRDFATLEDEYGEVPAPVKHAILMLVAHSYAQREPASPQNLYTVPYTLEALLKPYMIL